MNKTLLTAFLSGCTTTAIAGLLIIPPSNPKDALPESRVYIAECDNLHALSARRTLIKGAYELHRYKGTPWAIREIIRRLGFGEVQIIEHMGNKTHNGAIRRNGIYLHGQGEQWAHYRVNLNYPVTNAQAALLRRTLAAFAPARCILTALDYQAAPLQHNGKAVRDGTFDKGTA